MTAFWIILCIVAVMIFLIFIASLICFKMAFFSSRKVPANTPEFDIPPGAVYEPFRDQMINWMKEARNIPCTEHSITSFDGLKLKAKFYEYKKGAPIELMMHGYRGSAERDLCGGIQRCFSLGRSCLIVDQRGCGKSDGHVITFGIKERRDCIDWANYITSNIDRNAKIILCGISMGASTVLMASAEELPQNVVGVLADCGFTSAKAIIKKVIRDLKLPADILYPFVRLGAFIFGGFNLEETSAIEAVAKTKLPIIFYHGETDDFVPCEMSFENYNAAAGEKQIVTMKNTGHGLCYLTEPDIYIKTLTDFTKEHYKVDVNV